MAKTFEEKTASYHANLDRILKVFFKDDAQVELAEAILPDGTKITYENTEVGTPVFVVAEDGTQTPAPDGEHQISETELLVVKDGLVVEVKPVEPAEEVEEEMEVEPVVEETEVKGTSDIFNLEILKTKVDFTKEGFHTISFSIANGVIEWGNIYSESFQELSEQVSAKDREIAELKAKFEADLEILGKTIKETKVVQAPLETAPVALTKKDLLFRQLEEQRKEKSIY